MSTTTFVTAADLVALPKGMGKRYELIAGRLNTIPTNGWRHGQIVANLHTTLGSHIYTHDLGWAFASETGFLLHREPDTVRAPDFAFIAQEHLPPKDPTETFWPGAPDLAVEVLSSNDSMGEVDDKIDAWLAAGCAAVWVIDPKLETVTIYRSRTDVQIKAIGETLEGAPVVPGFSCQVSELFR